MFTNRISRYYEDDMNEQPEQNGDKKPKRANGKRMTDEQRAAKQITDLIDDIGRGIRTDYGGKPEINTLAKKARQWAEERGYAFTEVGYSKLAEYGMMIAADLIKGIQKRTKPNRDELKRRVKVIANANEAIKIGNVVDGTYAIDCALKGTTEPII